jgi:hypothetical protein
MARRITSGISGRSVLGSLTALNNSLQSVVLNADVVLEPNGTGVVQSTTDLQINDGGALRLADNDSSAYVAFKSPATLSASYTLTFPGDDGTVNQVLRTDGSGTLTWVAPFVTVANQVADGTTYYPAMTTSTSGTISTVSTSNSKLSFVPSSGTLTVSVLSTASAAITGGSINGTTVGASTRAIGNFSTMTATSIVEDSSIVYKENINPIENALDSILKLTGVIYDRIDGSSKNEAGLIAEEVAPIIPNVVAFKDGKPEGINYTKLSAYLIEAVKTLNQKIKNLEDNN